MTAASAWRRLASPLAVGLWIPAAGGVLTGLLFALAAVVAP